MKTFSCFLNENVDSAYQYMRRTNSLKVIGDYGYALFVRFHGDPKIEGDKLHGYGKHLWIAAPYKAIDADHLIPLIQKVLEKEEHEDVLKMFHATAHKLATEANPRDIVDSAGLWDAPELVEIVWNEILDKHDYMSVITHDGMIIFDDHNVKRII